MRSIGQPEKGCSASLLKWLHGRRVHAQADNIRDLVPEYWIGRYSESSEEVGVRAASWQTRFRLVWLKRRAVAISDGLQCVTPDGVSRAVFAKT